MFAVQIRLLIVLHLREAVAAVNRAIGLRLERNFGFAAAVGAGSGEEFTRATGSRFAGVTAGLASLGLVLEAAFSVEFLFAGGENEIGAAFFALQGFVLEHGELPLFVFCPGSDSLHT